MSAKPAVLLVTGFPFWALGDGQRMRLLALVWVLGKVARLTVLYLGSADDRDVQRLRELQVNASFHALGSPIGPDEQRHAVQQLCRQQRFDVCILERLALDPLRDALPAGVRTVLDSHDLLSERERSRAARGLSTTGTTLAWELSRYARYDCVLMIQPEERALIADRLQTKVIVAPHPVVFPRRAVRVNGRCLGFVGAHNEPNIDGLDWFADEVWPRLMSAVPPSTAKEPAAPEMHVFGWIGQAWRPASHPAFVRHGFVADFAQVWGAIDVAINPVRWGSGLKIKSVEALGNGVPLVTTREGARGLAASAAEGYVLADDADAFAGACQRLLAEPAERERLGAAGHAWARRHLSPQACFGEFVNWLTN